MARVEHGDQSFEMPGYESENEAVNSEARQHGRRTMACAGQVTDTQAGKSQTYSLMAIQGAVFIGFLFGTLTVGGWLSYAALAPARETYYEEITKVAVYQEQLKSAQKALVDSKLACEEKTRELADQLKSTGTDFKNAKEDCQEKTTKLEEELKRIEKDYYGKSQTAAVCSVQLDNSAEGLKEAKQVWQTKTDGLEEQLKKTTDNFVQAQHQSAEHAKEEAVCKAEQKRTMDVSETVNAKVVRLTYQLQATYGKLKQCDNQGILRKAIDIILGKQTADDPLKVEATVEEEEL